MHWRQIIGSGGGRCRSGRGRDGIDGSGRGGSGRGCRGGGMHWRCWHVSKASEVAACIESIGMHWKGTKASECVRRARKHRNASEVDGADGATVNTQVSEAVKVVRTHLNWMVLVWGYFCCM
jgi:hypothetical protein